MAGFGRVDVVCGGAPFCCRLPVDLPEAHGGPPRNKARAQAKPTAPGVLWVSAELFKDALGVTATGSIPSGRQNKRAARDQKRRRAHLEVSDKPNDAHTHRDRDVPEATARDCARSCSLGRTRHLCKLLLGKGRLRAARRALGPDPSRTQSARTAHSLRGVCGARWALTGRRRGHRTHTKARHPLPPTTRSPVPLRRRRPINATPL